MRIASAFVCTLSTLTILAACSGDEVTVGKTDQALTTKKDGTPTGNGTTCSWSDTAAYDAATSDGTVTVTSPAYAVGDDFASLDGCNECTCTVKGIMCTIRACGGGGSTSDAGAPKACPALARVCPPGQTNGPTGPNCELTCVPSEPTACSTEAKLCPDGKTSVGRTGPDCAFAACP